MIRSLLLSLAVLCCVGTVGCGLTPFTLIPAGVDLIIFWKDGLAKKYYTGNSDDIYGKLKVVLNGLEHKISKDEINNNKAHSMVTHSQNHKFSITVSQHDPKISLVEIRIDFMGDKPYAELIFRKLDEQLGVKTTKIIEEEPFKHHFGERRHRR